MSIILSDNISCRTSVEPKRSEENYTFCSRDGDGEQTEFAKNLRIGRKNRVGGMYEEINALMNQGTELRRLQAQHSHFCRLTNHARCPRFDDLPAL
jgi:hypothetical protein